MAKYIGLDISNEYIGIYEKDEGITLCERNCMCVDIVTRENLAIGNAAYILAQNTPGAVELVTDIYTKDGMKEELLTLIISEMFYSLKIRNPYVIIAVKKEDKPSQIAALANVILEAGAREVFTTDVVSTCALGSGIMVNDKRCMLACDICDEFSVLAIIKGCINKGSKTFPFSRNKLLEAITTFIKNEKNCTITKECASSLLDYAVSARPEFEYDGFAFTGIDIVTGLPVSGKYTSEEILEVLSPFVEYLCENIKVLYSNLPVSIIDEVSDKGVLLCGNINLITRLKDEIETKVGLRVSVSDFQDNASIMGIGVMIDNLEVFEVMLKAVGDE